MSEEEKQIMNKMIYCNLVNGEQALKFNRHIKQIQEENEQLHSIIKEVREYIKEMQVYCIEFESWGVPSKELLEILDKENK